MGNPSINRKLKRTKAYRICEIPENSIVFLDVYSYAVKQLKSKKFTAYFKGNNVSPEYNIYRKVVKCVKRNCQITFVIDSSNHSLTNKLVFLCRTLKGIYENHIRGFFVFTPAEKLCAALASTCDGVVISEDSDIFEEKIKYGYQWSKKKLYFVDQVQQEQNISIAEPLDTSALEIDSSAEQNPSEVISEKYGFKN